jgi:hypothetical protein
LVTLTFIFCILHLFQFLDASSNLIQTITQFVALFFSAVITTQLIKDCILINWVAIVVAQLKVNQLLVKGRPEVHAIVMPNGVVYVEVLNVSGVSKDSQRYKVRSEVVVWLAPYGYHHITTSHWMPDGSDEYITIG